MQIKFSHKDRTFEGFIGGCGEAFHIVDAESREIITTIPTDMEANGFSIHDDYLVIAETALDAISLIKDRKNKKQEVANQESIYGELAVA